MTIESNKVDAIATLSIRNASERTKVRFIERRSWPWVVVLTALWMLFGY